MAASADSYRDTAAGLPLRTIGGCPANFHADSGGSRKGEQELNLRRVRFGFDKPHIEHQVYPSGIRKGSPGVFVSSAPSLISLTTGPSGQES